MIWSMVGSGIQKSIISFLRSFFQMGQAVVILDDMELIRLKE